MFEGKVLDFDEGVSLRDAVCGVLRAAILTGELEAGDRLMEIPLAEQMGVSRTPVREAIRRLEEEGLVIITPKCGARVASYTEKEVTDALDVRMHIESMSVKLAAMYITAEQVDILKEINKEKKSFNDLGITYEEKAFYDILIAVAKQFGFDYPEDKAKALAGEIKKIIDDKSKYTDWAKRDDIKAELKMDLILILAEYGYPPVTNDEVFKEIFEQAENFKKYNS